MREIKFRAWDIGLKRWLYEDINLYTSERDENEIIMTVGGIADSGIEFHQFTGLKDKNGKEIYEGDIFGLDIVNKDKDLEFEYNVVIWNNDKSRFELKNEKGDCDEISLFNMKDVEVIGNKFENPELLGENK